MAESRIKNSITNMFFGVSYRVMLLILNFILRTIIIQTIGVEYLGINGTLSDVLSLLCMADLGFNTAIVYSFYEPLAQNNTVKIIALVGFYKKVYMVIAAIIGVAGISLIPFLDYIIKTDHPVPYLMIYYILMLMNVVCSYLFVYKASILTADQKDYVRVRIAIVFNLAKIIFQIIALLWLKSYMLYLILTLLATFFSNMIASREAVKNYPYINQKGELDVNTKKDIYFNMKSVVLYKVSTVMLNATDNTLISMLIGTLYVGYYSNYFLLVNSLSIIFTIIYTSTTASVGNLVVTESEKTRLHIFEYMQTFILCMCCIVVPCYTNLVNDCIYIWLGKDFEIDFLSQMAIAVNFYINCVFLPVVSFREAVGLYRQTRYVMIITAILNIVLSIILGRAIGMAGILIATPIARMLTYVWYEPRILFKEFFGCSAKSFFVNFLLNACIVIGITALCHMFTREIQVVNWVTWFFKACICGIVSLALMVIFYSKADGFKWSVSQIGKIVRRK